MFNVLTEKNQPFVWGLAQEQAFQTLKDAITWDVILCRFLCKPVCETLKPQFRETPNKIPANLLCLRHLWHCQTTLYASTYWIRRWQLRHLPPAVSATHLGRCSHCLGYSRHHSLMFSCCTHCLPLVGTVVTSTAHQVVCVLQAVITDTISNMPQTLTVVVHCTN